MKTLQSTQGNRKKWPIIIGLVLILVVALLVFAFLQQRSSVVPNLPKSQEDNYVTDENQPLNNEPTNQNNDTKVLTPENSNHTSEQLEKPAITRAEQTGDYIRVSAIFNNASNGSCVLRLQKSGYADTTLTAPIVVGPSYYTCNGFRVPKSDLPASGEWKATVTHERSGADSVTSDTKTIEVQ